MIFCDRCTADHGDAAIGWSAMRAIFSTGTTPRTLQPLLPRYVSTVDSGNLLASLWVLERGCHDQLRAPLIGAACLRGLSDTLASASRSVRRGPVDRRCRCKRCGACCEAESRAIC